MPTYLPPAARNIDLDAVLLEQVLRGNKAETEQMQAQSRRRSQRAAEVHDALGAMSANARPRPDVGSQINHDDIQSNQISPTFETLGEQQAFVNDKFYYGGDPNAEMGGPQTNLTEAEELELLELELELAKAQKTRAPATKPSPTAPQWDGVIRKPDVDMGDGSIDFDGLRSQMLPEATRESRMEDFNEMMEGAEPAAPGRAWTAAANVAQSGTLGLADDIAAVPKAIIDQQPYGEARQDVRSAMAQGREEHPVTGFAGEMAGYLAPGTVAFKAGSRVAKPVVQAAQKIGPRLGFGAKVATGAGVAAADAALYGGTVMAENEAMAEGGEASLEDRAQGAQEMAPWGAAFGAAFPVAAVMLRPAGRWAGNQVAKVKEATGLAPGAVAKQAEKVGAEAVRRDLERAGIMSAEDFAERAAQYGGKPVVTGELTQPTLNTLTALVRGKGTTAEKAMAILEDRVQGLPGRLLRDISEETGLKPEAVYGQIEEMVKQGRATAAPLYEAAEAQPFEATQRLEQLVAKSPSARDALKSAEKAIADEAAAKGVDVTEIPPLRLYDEVKRYLDEEVNQLIKQGKSPAPVEQVRAALVETLDEIVPGAYAAARQAGGDAPRAKAAFESGQKALSGRFMADDIAREVAELTAEPLTAYQSGVVRNMQKEIEAGRLSPNRVRKDDFQKKLREVFGGDAGGKLIQRLLTEAELMQKGARWNPNVGSVTSQALGGEPSKAGDEAVRAGVNLLTGNKPGLIAQAARAGANAFRRGGYNENQLNAIGDILLSSPDDASKIVFGSGKKAPTTPAAQAADQLEGVQANRAVDADPDAALGAIASREADKASLSGIMTEAAVGSTGGSMLAQDLDGDGEVSLKERAAFAGLGAVGVPAGKRVVEKAAGKGGKSATANGQTAQSTLDLGPQNRVYGPGSPDDLGFYTSAERALANPPPRFKDAKALTADQWRAYFKDAGVSKEGFEYQVDAALKGIGAGNAERIPKAQVEEALARARPKLTTHPGDKMDDTEKALQQQLREAEDRGDQAAVSKSLADLKSHYREIRDRPMRAENNYEDYVAPGKYTHYSQEQIIAPDVDYTSHNWSTSGTLGHIRTTQRKTANGEKTLHVEELQSDLHQEGAKHGYQTGARKSRTELEADAAAAEREFSKASDRYDKWWNAQPETVKSITPRAWRTSASLHAIKDPTGLELARTAEAAKQRWRQADQARHSERVGGGQPPRAPLENWEGTFIERALYKAAQEGHDLVTFPVGRSLHEGVATAGTKKFYDERLPKHLQSVAKKYGLQVEQVPMQMPASGVRITRDPTDGRFRAWGSNDQVLATFASRAEADRFLEGNLTVPAIRLTPQARNELSKGVQVMGGVGMAGAAGGTMFADQLEQ